MVSTCVDWEGITVSEMLAVVRVQLWFYQAVLAYSYTLSNVKEMEFEDMQVLLLASSCTITLVVCRPLILYSFSNSRFFVATICTPHQEEARS